ncbi:hypothetical protein RRG08_031403 [Elysia crispata]|uniref:Uncharacterized protein n=1 Tax=Elysia crispata TaxID=231223 RepID=A0AAE1DIV9_9GAST|nr:hypothetical protein RRG08_031403 [Elysia crispata]
MRIHLERLVLARFVLYTRGTTSNREFRLESSPSPPRLQRTASAHLQVVMEYFVPVLRFIFPRQCCKLPPIERLHHLR